jgi:putative redox protein
MKASVRLIDELTFEGTSGSGHRLTIDSSPDVGGKDRGPRPMEMLLLGLASCSAIDVVLILRKGRQTITDCQVDVSADRAEDHPRVFTRIHMHFVISGHGVDGGRVERAIKLSADKYCSASAMLGAVAEISHDFEIREAEPDST